jgi:glycosyltransferase involved in cell wall biosynthesis
MIRVLIIAYSNYVRDGRVKRHAEALADRGDHIDVICLADPQLRSGNGVTTIGIEMPRCHGASRIAYAGSYVRFFTRAAATALRLSRPQRYDVVIVCSIPDAVVLCALPLKLLGSRVILDVHDTMPELYSDKFGGTKGALGARLLMLEERSSAWLADRVLAVHDLHRTRLEGAGIPSQKIRVVLNSPDSKIFSRAPNRRNGGGGFTLVCHGTVTRRLGLDVAFKALDLLGDKGAGVRLLVIGKGDHLSQAQAQVAAMKLRDRVSFLPPVPIEELPELLAQADVGLVPNQPSAATHLMLPVKLLEYATLGIPIISARLRTVEHYFRDDAIRFFEPGNPAELAAAITELKANRERGAALASRAWEMADTLSWKHQSKRYFDAIDSLIGADARTAVPLPTVASVHPAGGEAGAVQGKEISP